MTIVQVVRQFGPVGGMESYVWHLSRELAALGESVVVICEASQASDSLPAAGVQVIEVGSRGGRPRWLNYLSFSRRVATALSRLDLPDPIVHSHERTGVHQVTTFHSEPFTAGRAWHGRLSPRIAAYLWMERREVCGTGRRPVWVVPVSEVIRRRLRAAYPGLGAHLTEPIRPGVATPPQRPARRVSPQGGVIGFVGREWKRKGLQQLLDVSAVLARKRPLLRLLILGPESGEIAAMCQASGVRFECLGWTDSRPHYASMDLLVHPASSEAYGMAVAEAMAAQVPVLVSDRCGVAADVDPCIGSVLSLSDPVEAWAGECDRWLAQGPHARYDSRGWALVAQEYRALYRRVARAGLQ